MPYLGTISQKKTKTNKNKNRMILVHFQGKPFNITVIQTYAPITDIEEAEVDQFYEEQ